MTTPLVPWFIGDLFKEEINKIQLDVVDRICTFFCLDKEEVLKVIDVPEITFTDGSVRIIKKNPEKYGSKSGKDKCIARVYDKNERTLCQCKRSQKKNCDKYCKSHFDLVKGNKLTLGTINDPVPKHIENKIVTKIY